MDGDGETGHGRLWAGGKTIVGEVGNKDLRRMDKGIRFLAKAETAGMDGEQTRRSVGEGERAGQGLTAAEGARVVESRGGDDVGDSSTDRRTTSTSTSGSTGVEIANSQEGGGRSGSVSGSGERASGVSTEMNEGASFEAAGAWTSCWKGGALSNVGEDESTGKESSRKDDA